jgi:hypothetical protein
MSATSIAPLSHLYFIHSALKYSVQVGPKLSDPALLEDKPARVPASAFQFHCRLQNQTTETLSRFRGDFVSATGIEPVT